MTSQQLIGAKLRAVRAEHRMTLKELESTSGCSSTSISEIERGRTSPTIGSLIRLANALGKDPSYFVDDQRLEETGVVALAERGDRGAWRDVQGQGVRWTSLTGGILGGRLVVMEVRLEPGGVGRCSKLNEHADACLYGLEGTCEVEVAGGQFRLGAGDSLHAAPHKGAFVLRETNSSTASVLLVLDPRQGS